MYIFVVDTDSYAGDFEREMTAYMTGQVGECGVGGEFREVFAEETGNEHLFDELVIKRPDDHGCFRPCKIWPTLGWFNNGMGGHFRDGQEDEAKEDYCRMCTEEFNKHGDNQWLVRAKAPLAKYSAYLSFAIFMSRKPSVDEVALLKERALKWPIYVDEKKAEAEAKNEFCFLNSPTEITGFRLIEETTTQTECSI